MFTVIIGCFPPHLSSCRSLDTLFYGCMFASVFPGPLMRWNGWRKCQIYFRVLELRITLLNQRLQQKGMKNQRTKRSHGKWWWTRNTSSCGGALLRAPTFTSTEVSHACCFWHMSMVLRHAALCSLYFLNYSVLALWKKVCQTLVYFPLPDDKLFIFLLNTCHLCLALLLLGWFLGSDLAFETCQSSGLKMQFRGQGVASSPSLPLVVLVFGTYTDVTPRQFFNVQVS